MAAFTTPASDSAAAAEPMARGADRKASAPMLVLGFCTIGAQLLFIREIFTALYGSDLAIAFTLASWTLFTGLGARAAGFWRPKLGSLLPVGLALYAALAAVVFLWVRRWGAQDVTAFAQYFHIPPALALPCLLGGALFTWGVPVACGEVTSPAVSGAYADETAGGLLAAALMTAYFAIGGHALAVFPFMAIAAIALCVPPARTRMSRRSFALAAILVLPLGCLTPFERLERKSLLLRYPDGEVLVHRNTPFGCLTAVRKAGRTALFENGTPCEPSLPTPAKVAVAAFLTQLSDGWDRVQILNGLSQGFGPALGHLNGCQLLLHEQDRHRIEFLAQGDPDFSVPPHATQHVSVSPWRTPEQWRQLDLIVHLSPSPGSLQVNQQLTVEFFRNAHRRLAPGGALGLVLPKAPGFTHPTQQEYVVSVKAAMQRVFRHVQRYDTELGYLVLAGRDCPLPHSLDPVRLKQRLRSVRADTESELLNVFFALELQTALAQAPRKPRSANTVEHPVAYFTYLLFRGRMVEGFGPWLTAMFDVKPWWVAGVTMLVLLAGTGLIHRCAPHGAMLFWASWGATMTLMLSVYFYQSIAGQAYWLVAALIAASMAGVDAGARATPMTRILPGLSTARGWGRIALLAGVLLAPVGVYRALHDGPLLLVSIALAYVTAVAGLLAGAQFRHAASGIQGRTARVGTLYLLDLAGAAAGLLIGGAILPCWIGFDGAAALCAAAIVLCSALIPEFRS